MFHESICSYSLLRLNSIVRVLYQNAGKNLPLIVRAQPRRYACFGSKPTYKKLINTKIRQNRLKSRPASRLQVKLRVEERPKPRDYKNLDRFPRSGWAEGQAWVIDRKDSLIARFVQWLNDRLICVVEFIVFRI